MTKPHSFKSCFFGEVCEDPCGQASVNVDKEWRKNPEYKPVGDVDRCSMLGRCRMQPTSARCYSHRCRECAVWLDRDMDPEEGASEDKMKLHLFCKMLARKKVAHEPAE